MKRVRWTLNTPYAITAGGGFEVDDNTTSEEIDKMVKDEILSSGMLIYNWTTQNDA